MVFGIMSSQQQHEMVITPSLDLHCFFKTLSIASLIKTAILLWVSEKVLKYFILYIYMFKLFKSVPFSPYNI